MQVGVSYALPDQQVWVSVELPEGSTIQDGIERSGVLETFPDIDLERQRVGVFGKLTKLDAPAHEGDRIEIYRPIIADPKKAKARQADTRPG